MPLNGKNRARGKLSLGPAAFRNLIFWSVIVLAASAVWFFLRPSPITGRGQQPAAVKKTPADRPVRETASRASRRVDSPQTEAIPESVPKVQLKMDRQRPLTPRDDYMAPRWSRDGLDVLVTKGKYTGLYLVSRDGTDIRRISDEPGVGYHARWSPDGNYIVVENGENTRFYDRSGREVEAASEKAPSGPPVYAKEGVLYRRKGTVRSETDEVVMADEDQYFEPVVSPDKTKIAYIGLESGIVIKDLQNEEDVIIGQGTDICWLPDSSGIIFNYTQDDGEQIIDGDIYFAYADGRTIENLTNTPDTIERHPDLSSDGSQLTYEMDGRIYSVEVEIQ